MSSSIAKRPVPIPRTVKIPRCLSCPTSNIKDASVASSPNGISSMIHCVPSLLLGGFPGGYPTTAPTYTPNLYQTGSPGYPPGYATGTPYKVPPTQTNGAPPPYSPSPSPYQAAMYPIRSAYPQQNLYAQGAYYAQPVYAAQPHVIHHTTVVQPNSIPSAIYPSPVPAPRSNGVAVGMVAGTTMAMSAGTLLTTPQHTQHIGAHPVAVPTYRPQGTPGYSYVPPHW
ncbi:protein FAM168A-like isoform X1 [Brienomyrus brachyistius]|uniref:protein FAM168A-like isoform X1 n=1 Tax=Brienomyrus brachyistius TaxID=42636 RepID=UPI0020B1C29D|nr:protein FAM168A-like isoform X1 [Brienomyrus brachyistius]